MDVLAVTSPSCTRPRCFYGRWTGGEEDLGPPIVAMLESPSEDAMSGTKGPGFGGRRSLVKRPVIVPYRLPGHSFQGLSPEPRMLFGTKGVALLVHMHVYAM